VLPIQLNINNLPLENHLQEKTSSYASQMETANKRLRITLVSLLEITFTFTVRLFIWVVCSSHQQILLQLYHLSIPNPPSQKPQPFLIHMFVECCNLAQEDS